MDEVETLQALRASATGRAQPLRTIRHVHVADKPFGIVAYHLAGDEGAPLAFMFGTDPDPAAATVVVVPEPRNRELRFEALAEFGEALNNYLAVSDGPQLLFANDTTANWLLDLVASYTRYVQAGPPSVAEAGKNMSQLFQLMTVPGSSIVLRATSALSTHFKTGQLSTEDLNLGAQLAWITDPGELTAAQAAAQAEVAPPAGPQSDPEWDASFLEGLMGDWRSARRAANPALAQDLLRQQLERQARSELTWGWRWMWQARDILAALPEAPYVAARYAVDVAEWGDHVGRMRRGEARFADRPNARFTATRLQEHEMQLDLAEARAAGSDPLVLARDVVKGEVVDGTVLSADLTARVGRLPRPRLVVQPAVECTIAPGSTVYLTRSMSVEMRVGPTRRAPLDPITLTVESGANNATTMHLLPSQGKRLVASLRKATRRDPPPMGAGVPWTHVMPGTS